MVTLVIPPSPKQHPERMSSELPFMSKETAEVVVLLLKEADLLVSCFRQ